MLILLSFIIETSAAALILASWQPPQLIELVGRAMHALGKNGNYTDFHVQHTVAMFYNACCKIIVQAIQVHSG